ncbi:hypothetical protein MNEG_0406 [Monoraphidium neglectum]|uniref:N-acetyltransferase domain-containing protein n=1 Tax=Monoraphidium neglectum TaxID=145388 RepID=A0A0D2LMK3_9CHLO|nr:hypothetical protein MNEG_0406 [Monoraphidium neglectum]KIZ07544.1 hypothetical protein MNEG_0406 [Monoraphidium neglectum]|eukprot:XP_013906563.1 hypothetical protein MNEG_0406 [Monoraphidium neglectum]
MQQNLCARCFHDRLPWAPLDSLAFTVFKAEVVDGLKSKAKCVDPETYAMLVVEDASGASSSSESSSESSSSSGSSRISGSGDGVGDGSVSSEIRREGWVQRQVEGDRDVNKDSGAGAGGASVVLGIVELGLQETGENVRELRQAGVLGGDAGRWAAEGDGAGAACVYLSSMAVAPPARRAGAARAMLRAAQWQAALWGQRHIALHVFTDNEPAVRLYSSAGWRPVGRDPGWRKWVGAKIALVCAALYNFEG